MNLSVSEMSLCKYCSAREGIRTRTGRDCSLCNGLFERIEDISREVVDKLDDYQFDSFLIGIAMPPKVLDNEDELRARLRIKGKESIKSHFNSILTRKIVSLTRKNVDYSKPDVTVLLSLPNTSISISSRSIWLSARYKKLKRGISQRFSNCPVCNGLGCAECAYKGKSGKNVESLVSSLFSQKFKAESCNFVWLGSEDENSLVNGSGRPFFVEVIQPRQRFASSAISKQAKSTLDSEGLELVRIKRLEKKFSDVPMFDINCKVYLKSDGDEHISELHTDQIEKNFSDRIVNVRLNRRYRVVQRVVRTIRATVHEDGTAELIIECEGGIPIKKFVTGQDNTVEPNLSHLIQHYHIDPERPFDILDVKFRRPDRARAGRSRHSMTLDGSDDYSEGFA